MVYTSNKESQNGLPDHNNSDPYLHHCKFQDARNFIVKAKVLTQKNTFTQSNNRQTQHTMTLDDFRKFPRTYHLFEVQKGRMARDDLLLEGKNAQPFYKEPVTVEEKIDGSNLGLSLDPNTLKILAQNRSHYVTSQSHQQFKTLDIWINEHPELYDILHPHYILFGEWVYAKHSLHYDRLPGYFVAFDIYDKKAEKYLSVKERNKRLKDTTIPVIQPLVLDQVMPTRQHYEKLLDTKSHYIKDSQLPLEGIYIRVDDDQTGYLKHRCKVVRSDFIQTVDTSGHWMTKEVVKNQIDYELMYQ
jgi:ATP-dependent RNA circularization protein (DNA/RNA ligase family)